MTRFPAVAAVLLTLPLAAQHTPPKPTHIASADVDKALPLRRVSLYKNGVGYFEHIGSVTGSPRVTITFTTAQLNDVLQTLTAVDLGGGHVTGAGYNSTTPLEQQLKNLPVSLSADPTAADFYSAIRGARVEVTGSGAPITGRILNVELRNVSSPQKDEDDSAVVQKHFLTIISDAGAVRSLELTGNTSVRLLDPVLQDGVKRYLQVLNSTRSDGLRHLTLTDSGSGTREMRVSYISEVPVWKSTYRILFDEKPKRDGDIETATLQGWAVIDNTVGTDWENVQLSLIAGAPQSFIQPISQPYYSRRPEVEMPEEMQLTPQTHESGESPQMLAGVAGVSGGVMGGMGHGIGSGSNMGAGYLAAPVAKMAAPPPPPIAYEDSASASIAPATKTSSFDDYFEYKLTDPITIRRNESALVPILQTKIPAERVTLWSESQPAPLRALWITNASNLTLDRGSFSIVENGNFGGQGLLDPIHPKEKRLLSYAADQAVHVSDNNQRTTRRMQQIALSKGVLTEKTVEIAERSYLVHNAASETRTVIVEHSRHRGWDLDSDPKPVETTDGIYRFRVVAAPDASVRLHVGERHTLSTHYRIAQMDERQIDLMLRTAGATNAATEQALREKLAPVIDARHKLADIDAQIENRNAEIGRISDDQKRVRENLSSLKSSAEERDLIRRYTKQLNEQEDRLVVLRKEIESLQQQRTTAQADLDRVVEGLQFEQEV